MRTFAAVTTCHEAGYDAYGRQMVASFDRHWPREVPLYLYAENFVPELPSDRIIHRDLLVECPELVAFKERHKDNPAAHGKRGRSRLSVKMDWRKPKLRVRRVEWGLGYIWDAVRFSHKTFAIFDAAEKCPADVLFWVDADTLMFADIPHSFLEEVTPPDCLFSYLARPKFSECGFVGYNLRHPAIRDFLADFKALYTHDRLFKEQQYHDSFLFDVVRKRFERKGHKTYDIAEGLGLTAGHVFVNSRLGQYMDHMKGGRKTTGASFDTDIVVAREEGYWKEKAAKRPAKAPAETPTGTPPGTT